MTIPDHHARCGQISQFPRIYDLGSAPGEQWNLFRDRMAMGWEFGVLMKAVAEYEKSIAKYPNIKPGQEFTGLKIMG